MLITDAKRAILLISILAHLVSQNVIITFYLAQTKAEQSMRHYVYIDTESINPKCLNYSELGEGIEPSTSCFHEEERLKRKASLFQEVHRGFSEVHSKGVYWI